MTIKRLSHLTMLAGLVAALTSTACACSVCMGGSPDSPLMKGMAWGVLALLVVVVGVLAAVASFFIYLARRAGRTQSAESGFGVAANLNNV